MEECKYCFKSIENGATILDLLLNRDVLCPSCRRSLQKAKRFTKFHGIPLISFYIYNNFYSSLLVQYKECMDEALSDVFLYPFVWWIKIRFNSYTIVPIPSSSEKLAERGFNHVIKMVEQTKLPICDCLLKTENIKQAFLSKTQREKMKKDIKIKPGMSIPKRILLVDDVLTTGNTMMGALEALQGIDVKIKILVVANHPLNLRNKQERLF